MAVLRSPVFSSWILYWGNTRPITSQLLRRCQVPLCPDLNLCYGSTFTVLYKVIVTMAKRCGAAKIKRIVPVEMVVGSQTELAANNWIIVAKEAFTSWAQYCHHC